MAGCRTDIVMGEGMERAVESRSLPSPISMEISEAPRRSPRRVAVPGNDVAVSSHPARHDDESCPFIHGWNKPAHSIKSPSAMVREMTPETRDYLRKWGSSLFISWLRDADFLDGILKASAQSSPSPRSSVSS